MEDIEFYTLSFYANDGRLEPSEVWSKVYNDPAVDYNSRQIEEAITRLYLKKKFLTRLNELDRLAAPIYQIMPLGVEKYKHEKEKRDKEENEKLRKLNLEKKTEQLTDLQIQNMVDILIDYPRTKRYARISLIIAIVLGLLELIRFLISLRSN